MQDAKKPITPKRKNAPGAGRPKKTTSPVNRTPTDKALRAGQDAMATFRRSKAAELASFEDYEKAKEDGAQDLARALHAEWLKSSAARLKAEKDVLLIQQMHGQLVPAAEAEEEWSRLVATFKTALESMPDSIAPKLEGLKTKAIAKVLSDEVHKVLNSLADEGEE